MRFATRRRLIAAAALTALVIGGGVAAAQVRWAGTLGNGYGNAVGLPVRVGVPFAIGMAQVRPNHRIRIEAIRLHDPSPGVVLVGALVHSPEKGMVGASGQFPPSFPQVPMRPAGGAVVPAHAIVDLIVGMKATSLGGFRVHGIDLLYRELWHGLDLRRVAHAGVEVDGCATRRSPIRFPCMSPQPID